MSTLVNILFTVLSSETFKALLAVGVKKVVESKNISVDPKLAESLITDIARSNGNKLTKELATTVIKEL